MENSRGESIVTERGRETVREVRGEEEVERCISQGMGKVGMRVAQREREGDREGIERERGRRDLLVKSGVEK